MVQARVDTESTTVKCHIMPIPAEQDNDHTVRPIRVNQ